VTGHGGGPREHADERAARPDSEQRGRESLREVEQRDSDPEPPPVDAKDVRRPDVPAPARSDVLSADEPRQPVAERQRAEEISTHDRERLDHV
jgi:hypothetical protein